MLVSMLQVAVAIGGHAEAGRMGFDVCVGGQLTIASMVAAMHVHVQPDCVDLLPGIRNSDAGGATSQGGLAPRISRAIGRR